MKYWLVKSEPEAYAWETFLRDKKTAWTGVRNFAARNHLRAMRCGDRVLFYESVTTKAVVGFAEVTKEAFPDATAKEGDWSAVELKAQRVLAHPVTLEEIKAEKSLAQIELIRQGRLSVVPLTKAEYETILRLGATNPAS
jgi:predicted RNA-binding protein with PUA-like domain